MAEWHWGIGVGIGPFWAGRTKRARPKPTIHLWLYPMAVCWVLSVAYPSLWWILANLIALLLLAAFGLYLRITSPLRKAIRWLQR